MRAISGEDGGRAGIFREFTPFSGPVPRPAPAPPGTPQPKPGGADRWTLVFTGRLSKNDPTSGTNTAWPALIAESLSGARGESLRGSPGRAIHPNECERHEMATDYDAPRKTEEDLSEDSIEALKARRTEKPSAVVDEDESDLAEGYELPGADLSGEELLVRVLPPQADEFTCASCFLVRHRSQVAREKDGLKYCKDCEG